MRRRQYALYHHYDTMKLTKDLIAIICLTIIMTVYAITIVILIQKVDENQVQSKRFANYMRCLIVPDEVRYEQIGREAYVRECELLLHP